MDLVPVAGLEPARISPPQVECGASAIPPHRQGNAPYVQYYSMPKSKNQGRPHKKLGCSGGVWIFHEKGFTFDKFRAIMSMKTEYWEFAGVRADRAGEKGTE